MAEIVTTPKIKIVYVITRSDIGGAQFHVLSLLNKFINDYDILLISGSHGVLTEQAQSLGLRTQVIEAIDSFNILSASLQLRAVYKQENPAMVHVHSSLAAMYGRCARLFFDTKVLYTVHGWHFSFEPNIIKRCLKIIIEFTLKPLTNYWINVSNFDYKLGSTFHLFRKKHVTTIANGVNVTSFDKPQTQLQDDITNVVFIGRATFQKNCESAIRVIELADKQIHLTMYISGGQVKEFEPMVMQSSAKDRITLIIDDPEAAKKLKSHPIMLITSRYEGMPLCALEALQAGLAIVSSDVCGMNELIQHEQNGYLLPQNSEEEMAKHLNRLHNNPKLCFDMANASRDLYKKYFTKERMLESTKQFYKLILAN